MNIEGTKFLENNRCSFSVWAPLRNSMVLHIVHPFDQKIEMTKDAFGYFRIETDHVPSDARYYYMPDGERDLPDPTSHFQPYGVLGPSQIVDHASYQWQDIQWKGLPFKDLILYEVHVGAFTPEGTFESMIQVLDTLVETGINAIEIMPIGQFSGNRNWGYDGVFSYAVQNSYGGPEGLKKLVDACHQKGIAVFLDVVYNHMGPEGNYFSEFGPYFTDRYHCPWGDAINLDGAWSDGVREYISNNPCYWFEEYHIDGLRLDAIHTIFDNGAVSIWQLMHDKIQLLRQSVGRPLYMIAESDLNSPRVLKDPEFGGHGFDAQWLDDFHHAVYVLLDKNGKERYKEFGRMEQLAKAYTDGFVISGEYAPFRQRKFGASSAGISGEHFVAFTNNHDQCGNRIKGEPLSLLIDFERLKLAAATLLFAPYVPMLFMGEEYASESPFFFFIDHSDPALIEAVRKGRKNEFAAFHQDGDFPDPYDTATFQKSKLEWNKRNEGKHGIIHNWFKKLIALRKESDVLKSFNKNNIKATIIGQEVLILHRQNEGAFQQMLIIFNFAEHDVVYPIPDYGHTWKKILDSKDAEWKHDEELTVLLPEFIQAGMDVCIPALSSSAYVIHE
ncbi:MAG: malto-oligosyltrehalose trehalohydrolase [Cytophagales bacterium]|nr:malto-oligosyltrehalose trehalohydrolase [Cytophaga sp.]